jgi:glycosyltransferase involved in cell wall biosynthesis
VRIHFLVNGGPDSAAGLRARRVAGALAEHRIHLDYRAGEKTADAMRMVRSLWRRRPDVVVAVDLASVPVLSAIAGAPWTRLVVDTGDAPADFLKLIQAPRTKYWAARSLERIGYGRARQIIVRSNYHCKQLSKAGYRNVHTVPDGVDLNTFRPMDASHLREELNLTDKFVVVVQGNFTWYPQLGGGMGWDLVQAIIRHPESNVYALLVGEGPGVVELQRMAIDAGLGDRIRHVGRVSYENLPRYLNVGDVCLLTQTNDPSSRVRTTGKLPCYMACERFIVASRVGTAAGILPEPMLLDYRGNWDDTYPDRLAARLDEVAHMSNAHKSTLTEELRHLVQPFDYEHVAKEFAEIIVSS